MTTPDVESKVGLRRGAIGLREVLFQSITAMAPGAAIAASIPSGAAFAGGALPLAVIVALVACLFTALSVAELAKHLPAAGSVATYSSRGLHPMVGFLVAWGYLFVEALVPTLLLLQLGFTVTGTFPGFPQGLWWPWALLGAVIVAVAGFWGARVSATLGTILGAFEILVFLVLAVLMIIKAGGSNTLSVFTSTHTPAGHLGFAGVIAGSVYTVLAFSGFEAAAPMAEEARNPKRTIRRAVVGATLAIGAVYIFTTYAAAVFVGPDKFNSFGTTGALSWEGISKASFGIFWIFVFLAIVNSTIANANAGANVSTRTAFALARVGVLPKAFARVHPKHRSPVVAVATQFAVAVVATLVLGFVFTPTTAFVLVATIIVVVVVSVYIVVNAACIGFFLRFKRSEFNWFLHLVSPILGIVVFVPALLTSAGIPVFSFVSQLTPPVSYAGLIVGAWMVIGIGYLAYLWSRHRQRVVDTGLVHLDVEPEAETVVSA
jgi:amino acid transporter